MSFHYLPDLVGVSTDRSSSDDERFAGWKSPPTTERCSSDVNATACFPCSRFGMTSEPSTEDDGLEKWISSLPDSRVNRGRSPEREKEDPTTGISGPTPSGLSAKSDRNLSSWKMFPDCSVKKAEYAYAAGLIDGEGCIGIRSYKKRELMFYLLTLEVTMGRKGYDSLKKMQLVFGGNLKKLSERTERHDAVWRWSMSGVVAEKVIKEIFPFLIVKSEQAGLAIRFCQMRERGKWTKKTREMAEQMKQEMHKLNARGPSFPIFPAGSFARFAEGEWVTGQLRLDGTLEPFCSTWSRAGSMRDGIVFQRRPLAPLTGGIVFGLLPTPTVTDYGKNKGGKNPKGKDRLSLQSMARRGKWPTPTASEALREHEYQIGRGKKYPTLTGAAKIWPTPNAGDGVRGERKPDGKRGLLLTECAKLGKPEWPTPKATPSGPDYARAGRPESGGDDLATAVAKTIWPTPTKQDSANNAGPSQWERKTDPLNVAVLRGGTSTPRKFQTPTTPRPHDDEKTAGKFFGSQKQKDLISQVAKEGGQLNAEWVEWLMGWPIGGTDLRPLEKDRFQRWLLLHGLY